MYPVHRNETGSFQELARRSGVDFGQLSVLRVNPTCVRGGHYHARKKEWFCPIMGQGVLKILNMETNEERGISLDGFKKREFFLVNPHEVHWVANIDPFVDLEVLIIISEEFAEHDPDTFKYEGEEL